MDRRRAKRLAHQVRRVARRHGLPHLVWTSPLRRCVDVARWLRRWGWAVKVDRRLAELDFGHWEGRAWTDIPWAEVDAWRDDLLHARPGGGESLAMLAARAHAFAAEGDGARLVLTHGGWINALVHAGINRAMPTAAQWPAPPACGSLVRWERRERGAS